MGGLEVFVGDFCQVQIITADIADGIAVNNLVPTLIDADNIALAALSGSGNTAVTGGGAAAKIYSIGVYCTVSQFCILFGEDIQKVLVHITGFQVVIYFVPFLRFAENNHTFLVVGNCHNTGCGIGLTAKPK